MSKELESIYVNFGDTSVQVTIERLVELVGIEAVKSAVDEIAAQQNMHWTAATPCPYCKGQHDKRLTCPKYMAYTPPPVM